MSQTKNLAATMGIAIAITIIAVSLSQSHSRPIITQDDDHTTPFSTHTQTLQTMKATVSHLDTNLATEQTELTQLYAVVLEQRLFLEDANERVILSVAETHWLTERLK